jgi:hypothetical protein
VRASSKKSPISYVCDDHVCFLFMLMMAGETIFFSRDFFGLEDERKDGEIYHLECIWNGVGIQEIRKRGEHSAPIRVYFMLSF